MLGQPNLPYDRLDLTQCHPHVSPTELLQEIQKEGAKYVRHSFRTASNQALSAKDTAIPSMIQAHYDEVDKLTREKESLAERIVQLVMRTKARLDCDLNRILVLQGEGDLAVQAAPRMDSDVSCVFPRPSTLSTFQQTYWYS